MIEWQGFDLAAAIQVVVNILGTLDHHDLLTFLDFRPDDYLRVRVDDTVGPS